MNRNDKAFDWRSVSLMVPALIFTAGAVAYLGEVFFPGALTQHEARRVGTWLMVVGSEGGSLPAMVEVWRKVALGRARWYDYVGTVISTMTTMLGFIIIWAREYSAMDAEWMVFIRQWGPLAELPLSVLDFVFGCGLELGVYTATHRDDERETALRDEQFELDAYERRMALEAKRIKLEEMRRAMLGKSGDTTALQSQVTDLTAALQAANAYIDARDSDATVTRQPATTTRQTSDKPATTADTDATSQRQSNDTPPTVAANTDTPTVTRQQWSGIAASLGDTAPTTARAVVAWLAANGYHAPSVRTVERWLGAVATK